MDILDSIQDIQHNLLYWFSNEGRHWIPWKLRKDGSLPKHGEFISPYQIWIAEIMLQQTQLKVVLPYWENWMNTFPALSDVAEADEQNILLGITPLLTSKHEISFIIICKLTFYFIRIFIN